MGERDETSAQDGAPDMSSLSALFVNCTLKRSPESSHTQLLMDRAAGIMADHGVTIETIRAADLDLATGVWPDMTEHGWTSDEWPATFEKVLAANILVIGTPIWLGEKSSVCTQFIERLYANSAQLNDHGQSVYYGRVAGCLITGNEDGIKHCSMSILYALQHLGYVIPPQADAGWIGEAGPGPSYGEDDAGFDNDFTNQNTSFMAHNLMLAAKLLADAGGFPAYGNDRNRWSKGLRDHANPEHRS
jgi:multimeric flavodoxin WrbA